MQKSLEGDIMMFLCFYYCFYGLFCLKLTWLIFEIQDGVQDGRHILKSPYYHRLLLYFHMQYIVCMVFEFRESIYDGLRVI